MADDGGEVVVMEKMENTHEGEENEQNTHEGEENEQTDADDMQVRCFGERYN